MEEYLQYMKTLRSQMTDVEYHAAKVSVEEQMQITTINTLEKDLDHGFIACYGNFLFEMPYNIMVWCGACNSTIAKGVRFNAEKKQTGNSYSTKKRSEDEMATVDKICKEEANAYVLFDPEVIKRSLPKGDWYILMSQSIRMTALKFQSLKGSSPTESSLMKIPLKNYSVQFFMFNYLLQHDAMQCIRKRLREICAQYQARLKLANRQRCRTEVLCICNPLAQVVNAHGETMQVS